MAKKAMLPSLFQPFLLYFLGYFDALNNLYIKEGIQGGLGG